MAWTIKRFHTGMLPGMMEAYNDCAAKIPYHWPVSREDFSRAILGVLSSSGRNDHGEILVAADQTGLPAGYIHFGTRTLPLNGDSENRKKSPTDTIYALFTREGCEEAAQTLLQSAVQALSRHGQGRMVAWPRYRTYPFYGLGHGGCWCGLPFEPFLPESGFFPVPDVLPELLYATALPRVRLIPLPGLPVRFRHWVEEAPGFIQPVRIRRHAVLSGKRIIGDCRWHCLDQIQGHPEARRVAYIKGLKVSRDYTGTGLAHTLLLQAFQAMAGEGIRAVVLLCRAGNPHVAIPLLESLGFVQLGRFTHYMRG